MRFAQLNLEMAVLESFLKTTGNLLFATALATYLDISIIIARTRGFTRKRIFFITAITLFSMLLAFLTYKTGAMYNDFVRYVESASADTSKNYDNKLAMATTTEKKSKLSYLKAQYIYENEGKIINYLDTDGAEQRYQPNKESINNREMLQFFHSFNNLQNEITVANVVIWLLSTLIAVYLGYTRKLMTKSAT